MRFKISGESLIVELAQIDGGGEGVLSALTSLARRYGKRRGLESAVDSPRLKLCRTESQASTSDREKGLPDS